MSKYKSQIQNLYLSGVRKRHQPVEVVLDTGTTLRGKIRGYDQFSITLSFREKVEVIYKSAILYISTLPVRPMRRPMRPGPRFDDQRPPRSGSYSTPVTSSTIRPTRTPPPAWDSDSEPQGPQTPLDPPPPKKMPRR